MAFQNIETTLKLEHNFLHTHWSDVVTLDVNPKTSDLTYKHHIARLMDVYTNHRSTINRSRPVPSGKKPSPLNMLYGVQGIITTDPNRKLIHKQREKDFNNRLVLTENIKRETPEHRNQSAAATSSSRKTNAHKTRLQRDHQPAEHTSSRNQRPLHRCDDASVTEQEMLIYGQYTFGDDQYDTFDKFTTMLSEFDHGNMINILEDALKVAKQKSLLEKFGGYCEQDEPDPIF